MIIMVDDNVRLSRKFGALSSHTFSIHPITQLIFRYFDRTKFWIDPFANASEFNYLCRATNDLNPAMPTTHHLDAVDFLKLFKRESVDGVLFDPPYSVRQIMECYQGFGKEVHAEDTRADFWSKVKDEIMRIVKPSGIVICCGWNSGGMGKSRGFNLLEVLMVHHGGIHNDTIVTVDKKMTVSLF